MEKTTFGNIFQNKKRVLLRPKGVHRRLDAIHNAGLLKLESKLRREWNDLLLQEETFWMQKSRVN